MAPLAIRMETTNNQINEKRIYLNSNSPKIVRIKDVFPLPTCPKSKTNDDIEKDDQNQIKQPTKKKNKQQRQQQRQQQQQQQQKQQKQLLLLLQQQLQQLLQLQRKARIKSD
jgi:hypothetical protein